MNQKPLFYDDWKDSFRNLIEDSGKSYKDCANFLWPDMKLESAYARLKDCLKAGGDQKLDWGQASP